MAREDLSEIIAGHWDRYGVVFFSSDVVILSPANGIVVVVHHNELMAILRGRPIGPTDILN